MFSRIRFTIGLKIYLIIGLCLVALLGVMAFESSSWRRAGNPEARGVKSSREVAVGIIKEEQAAAQKGRVSDQEARQRAAARIAAALWPERILLDQRHASSHGDASDATGIERHRPDG